MITFVGTIVQQYVGCIEGAGQDYARLESPQGIVEYHPANDTTGQGKPLNLGANITCGVETNPPGVGSGWQFTFNNLTIEKVTGGVTFDDVICAAGGVAVVFHLPIGTIPVGWILGAKLNVGVKDT